MCLLVVILERHYIGVVLYALYDHTVWSLNRDMLFFSVLLLYACKLCRHATPKAVCRIFSKGGQIWGTDKRGGGGSLCEVLHPTLAGGGRLT